MVHPNFDPEFVAGFEGVVPIIGMDGKILLTVMLHFDNWSECAAEVVIAVKPAQYAYQPKLVPIVLSSIGRSGSTLAVELISSHPSVIADAQFPYENKCALYWLSAALLLSSPADRMRSTINGEIEASPFSIGINPYLGILPDLTPESNRWSQETLPELMVNHFTAVINSYYQAVAIDCGKPQATHFIEKAFNRFLPPFMRELYPGCKEVVLVRDPRDIYVSICAFTKGRGYKYADATGFETEMEHIKYLGNRLTTLVSDWEKRKDASCLVRYEDLAADPVQTSVRIFEYLGIEVKRAEVDAAIEMAFAVRQDVKAHATSSSVKDSIARWRRELPESLVEACNSIFRPMIERYGYDLE